MAFSLSRWLKIALINLFIVACLGVTLRYKILYPLPFVDQKHLLHGHSHFAFAGWITQALMVLLVWYLVKQQGDHLYKKYKWLLYANLLTALGMLIAFPIEGYGLFSIIFSTASILVSYAFAFLYWRSLNNTPGSRVTHAWFKAAVLFNALSSLGAFALTVMMINNVSHQKGYLAAEYFYLHFQYNGWFFFACMGLFTAFISRFGIAENALKKIFRLFAFAAVPAYLLSTLWMDLPVWLYVIVVLSAFVQLMGWIWLVKLLKTKWSSLQEDLSKTARVILCLSALALTAKLLLQLGSTIPSLSDLAFGFRPIVIGYLHLVLLGVITLFLLGYLFAENHFRLSKLTVTGITIFAAAVILNEVVLMTQGVAAISYNAIPFVNEMLLCTALLLFTGALFMTFAKRNISKK